MKPPIDPRKAGLRTLWRALADRKERRSRIFLHVRSADVFGSTSAHRVASHRLGPRGEHLSADQLKRNFKRLTANLGTRSVFPADRICWYAFKESPERLHLEATITCTPANRWPRFTKSGTSGPPRDDDSAARTSPTRSERRSARKSRVGDRAPRSESRPPSRQVSGSLHARHAQLD